MIPSTKPVQAIVSNPVQTRQDVIDLLEGLLTPLLQYQSGGGARIRIGYGGVSADPVAAEFEGFARPLWGLTPLLAADPNNEQFRHFREKWVKGLDSGSDPAYEDEYWGTYDGINQRYVEMAAVGFSLAIAPGVFWDPLSPLAKDRLHRWLIGSNTQPFPPNNWRFFRVLVNMGLKTVGREYDPKVVEDEFAFMEEFYGPHGYPSDGKQPDAPYDYYANAFAIPFYSLIYARMTEKTDPARSQLFKARALKNFPHVVHLFSPEGSCIPYGRSMLYRFAASSFFSAVVYAGLEVPAPFSLGVLKGLIFRNIRSFTQNPRVFAPDGTLPIGYDYPNMFMSEDYNCPQSSYWALKSFLVLALPADHTFWATPEEPYPDSLLQAPYSVMKPWSQVFSHSAGHSFMLSAGKERSQHRNAAAKYSKLAYSSYFGFSVSTGVAGIAQFAPDSTISASIDEDIWVVRRDMRDIHITDQGVIRSTWKALDGLEIITWTIPPETTTTPYHTRIHKVTSSVSSHIAEAGFAIESLTGPSHSPRSIQARSPTDLGADVDGRIEYDHASLARSNAGISAIADLTKSGSGQVMIVSANSNLVWPRTVIPTIRYKVDAGVTWLAVKVFALPQTAPSAQDGSWTTAWRATEGETCTVEQLLARYPFLQ